MLVLFISSSSSPPPPPSSPYLILDLPRHAFQQNQENNLIWSTGINPSLRSVSAFTQPPLSAKVSTVSLSPWRRSIPSALSAVKSAMATASMHNLQKISDLTAYSHQLNGSFQLLAAEISTIYVCMNSTSVTPICYL